MAWDFFVMFLVILDSIILPFQLSFKHGMPEDAFDDMWFWFTTTIFFTDVSLGACSGIKSRLRVSSTNTRLSFWHVCLSFLPTNLFEIYAYQY